MRSDEATNYLHRRHAAVYALLEDADFDRGKFCQHLSQPFAGMVPDQIAVAFENTDADDFVTDLLEYLPAGDIPLFCYWLDKKLIRIPKLVLTAYAFEEYAEYHDGQIDALLVVRQTLDPEAVSAIIQRAVLRVVTKEVWVLSLLSTNGAQARLIEILPERIAEIVRFRRVRSADYGDDIFQLDPTFNSRESQHLEGSRQDQSPAIEQIDRKFFMPKLIEDRMRRRPEPDDDATPPPFALQ